MSNQDLLWYTHQWTISSAFALLPGQMNSREARAMMLAIGLHESNFNARAQNRMGPLKDVNPRSGPARGFWQFERAGGVAEILTSADTKDLALPICRLFLFDPTPEVIHAALGFNDVLAAVFARLLLFRDPQPMPSPIEVGKGYGIYLRNWRPNPDAATAHKKDWAGNFNRAWSVVKGDAQ